MMELNEELRRVLKEHPGEPLRLIDPQTRETYLLVRQEVYERIQHLLEDDTSLSKREVSALVERAMREYDENDPSLHLYQDD